MKKNVHFSPYIYSLIPVKFVRHLQNFHTIDTWHGAGNKKFKYKNVFINQVSSWGPAPGKHFIHIKILCIRESVGHSKHFSVIKKKTHSLNRFNL